MRLFNTAKNIATKVVAFKKDHKGMSTIVEILLIAVVMVALCTIFKTQASTLVTSMFTKITSALDGLLSST